MFKTVVMFINLRQLNNKKVVAHDRSNWKTHPYTLGSYCHIPVGSSADYVQMMAEPVLNASEKVLFQL